MDKRVPTLIPLFWPHVGSNAIEYVSDTLSTRWIGQAHKVDWLERHFSAVTGHKYCVAVNSGTAALHLAYVLAGIKDDDEVITPVLTCTASNVPLLWQRAKIVFTDITKDLLIDPDDIERRITDKTKAIVTVDFGGQPCDYKRIKAIARKHKLPIIEDAAQMVGGQVGDVDYIAYSFQAIKNVTAGDGGMLVVKRKEDYEKAKRLRWFGIDRELKVKSNWQPFIGREMTYDVFEVGYRYQMNDITASVALSSIEDLQNIIEKRKRLTDIYGRLLRGIPGVDFIRYLPGSSFWLFHVLVEDRTAFMEAMREKGIETNISHVRNDIYQVFGGKRLDLPMMNAIEDHYVCLPLNTHITEEDVRYICETIREYYG